MYFNTTQNTLLTAAAVLLLLFCGQGRSWPRCRLAEPASSRNAAPNCARLMARAVVAVHTGNATEETKRNGKRIRSERTSFDILRLIGLPHLLRRAVRGATERRSFPTARACYSAGTMNASPASFPNRQRKRKSRRYSAIRADV